MSAALDSWKLFLMMIRMQSNAKSPCELKYSPAGPTEALPKTRYVVPGEGVFGAEVVEKR